MASSLQANVGSPFALDLSCVGAGEPRHKGEQALALSISRGVIKLHGQATDWAREALWHVLDPSDRAVLKACGDQRCFIDTGATVSSREGMRTGLQLPIQDVIETVHGGGPFYMRPVLGMVAPRMGLWSIRRVRRSARPAARGCQMIAN